MSIFVLAGLLLSREDGFFQFEPHLRIHDVKLEQKSRFNPVVFLYMERDNFLFISILLIKRQVPVF
jgi:hypothetical protein